MHIVPRIVASADAAAPDEARRRSFPTDVDNVEVRAGGKLVQLTNLRKPFWPELGITKGDLLRYYAAVVARASAAHQIARDGDEAVSRTAPPASSSS